VTRRSGARADDSAISRVDAPLAAIPLEVRARSGSVGLSYITGVQREPIRQRIVEGLDLPTPYSSFSSIARVTARVRSATSSFVKVCSRCVFTVASPT